MTTFGIVLLVIAIPGAYLVGLIIGVAIGSHERKHKRPTVELETPRITLETRRW